MEKKNKRKVKEYTKTNTLYIGTMYKLLYVGGV